MLYTFRARTSAGIKEPVIEADSLPEADWRARTVCDEKMWTFIPHSCATFVVADKKSHPMPKEQAEKAAARVGA